MSAMRGGVREEVMLGRVDFGVASEAGGEG